MSSLVRVKLSQISGWAPATAPGMDTLLAPSALTERRLGRLPSALDLR